MEDFIARIQENMQFMLFVMWILWFASVIVASISMDKSIGNLYKHKK